MNERRTEMGRTGRLTKAESGFWGSAVLLGALWCVLGVLCIAAAEVASVAAVYYVGILLAISGLLGAIFGLRLPTGGAGVVVLGILSLVVGVLLIMHPGAGMAALTMLLIGYFWIAGLFRVVTAVVDRYEGWGWDAAYGVCAIIVGFIAARTWPASKFWLLGTLVGAELIARGATLLGGGLAIRRGLRAVTPAGA